MKKKIFLFALLLVVLTVVYAQSSMSLTYQVVLRNAQNQLVIKQENITVTASVWNAAGTSEQYRETHIGLATNANGLLTLMLGTGTPEFGTWASIDWSDAAVKTAVSYDAGSGTVNITSDPAPVTAVPFALQAVNVPSNISDLTNDAGYLTSSACGSVDFCNTVLAFSALQAQVGQLEHVVDSLTGNTGNVHTASLSIVQTGGGSINLCGNSSVDVTYTVTPSDGGSYTYGWSGSPTSTSGNTATYTDSSASTYDIIVTATHATEGYTLIASASTTVSNTMVSLGLCETEGVVTVKNVSGSPNSIDWGDLQTGTSVNASTTHDYSTTLANGIHSVTIHCSDESGCAFSRTMTVNVLGSGSTVADRTVKPCDVSDSHQAQTNGSIYTGNGYGGANHGLETVNGYGQVTSVTDYDGNEYPVVQIGSQCWLAENLRCSHSPKTGSDIVVIVGTYFENGVSKMATWYDNDKSMYEPLRYGLLYNWCAAMDTAKPSDDSYTYVEVATVSTNSDQFYFSPSGNHQGICPMGWHVPTDAEWRTMVTNAGASYYNGTGNAKLTAGCDWIDSGVEQNETNSSPGNYVYAERSSSGFSAVPAGRRFWTGFNGVGTHAQFWSSTQDSGYIYTSILSGYSVYVGIGLKYKYEGFSLRCVRD